MGYYLAGDVGQVAGLQRGGSAGYNPTPSLKAASSSTAMAAAPTVDAGGGGGRSYRRRNWGNVKALRRAMSRVEHFAQLAKSVMTFTQHHRMKKHRRRR